MARSNSRKNFEGIVKQKKIHEKRLMNKANVVGVAVGPKISNGKPTGEIAVKVYVEKKIPSNVLKKYVGKSDVIPQTLGKSHVKTDVIEVGKIMAEDIPEETLFDKLKRTLNISSINRLIKHRPVFPGISVGNIMISAGTIGCVCLWAGKKVLLSNAHVFCEDPFKGISEETKNTKYGEVSTNDDITTQQATEIIQQGSHDGGSSAERIGKLRKMVLIQESASNWVDCAMCELDSDIEVDANIPDIGVPTGIVPWSPFDESLLNMECMKSGRTTGTTNGIIQDINATVRVGYGDGKSALFKEQMMFSNMSAGGDSGSLIVRKSDKKAVALLFAGSDLVTIASPIEHALKPLGIQLYTEQDGGGGGEVLELNFFLTKEGNGTWTVKGHVKDTNTSDAITAGLLLDDGITTQTDANGYFQIDGIAEGSHSLYCEAEGYIPQTKEFEIV